MSAELLASIQTIADAATTEGLEITAPGSHTRVVLYQQSVILVHRFYTIVLCANCGGGKSAFVNGGDDLAEQQSDHLAQRLRASTPKCLCKPPVQKSRED